MKKQWFPCIRGIGEITEEPNCVLCTKLVSLREGLYIDATKVTRVWIHYDRNGARRPCGTFRVAVLMDLADGKQTAFNSSTFRFEAQANEAAASVLREINKIRSFNGLKDVEATNELRNLETLLKFSGDMEPDDEECETSGKPDGADRLYALARLAEGFLYLCGLVSLFMVLLTEVCPDAFPLWLKAGLVPTVVGGMGGAGISLFFIRLFTRHKKETHA